MPSLTSLAEELLAQAKQIDAYLETKQLPSPSFENDPLDELPGEMQALRYRIFNTSQQFTHLVRGPVMATSDICFSWTDMLSLRVIYRFKLAHAVPLEGSATYADIAKASGLQEHLCQRFIRAAMGRHIFIEDGDAMVRHSAISRLMATDQGFSDSIGLQLEELGPASTFVPKAWETWGQAASEPNQSAFSLSNGSEKPIFGILAQEPERVRRFGGAMQFYTTDDLWHLRHILDAYDWSSLDREGALLVDLGGGHGHVTQFLARNTKHLRFLVQDLPHVVTQAEKNLPADLKDRVSFAPQDFLTPQAADPAPTAFFFRWITHDWPDAYVLKIFQGLIPALRNGSKVLIYEYVLPDHPVSDQPARYGIQMDLVMLAAFNAKERTRAQFEKLLAQADSRFVLEEVRRPEGSSMSGISVTWKE